MHSGRQYPGKPGPELEQIIKTRVERRHKEMGFHIFSSKRLQRFERIPNAPAFGGIRNAKTFRFLGFYKHRMSIAQK